MFDKNRHTKQTHKTGLKNGRPASAMVKIA